MKATRLCGSCLLSGVVRISLPWSAEVHRSASQERPPALVFAGCLVYTSPAEPPLRNGVVVVREGRIAEVGARDKVRIPPGANRVACTGRPLLAGFWTSHVHFTQKRWLEAETIPPSELQSHLREMLLRYGFTSVFDTGSYLRLTNAIRRRIASGEVAGPTIFTAGEILYPKGGSFHLDAIRQLDFIPREMPEVQTAEETRQVVRQHIDEGADGIKLYLVSWITQPMVAMRSESVAAAVSEARARGKLVLGHPTNREGLELGLSSGVGVLFTPLRTRPPGTARSLLG